MNTGLLHTHLLLGGFLLLALVMNKVRAWRVAVLASAGQEAVVSGIESGEKVGLDGRENLRSGSPVIVRDGGSQVGAPAASAASPVKAMP